MSDLSELKHFIENIMQVNVTHMGGAGAGIIGSSDTSNDIVNNLKKSVITLAREYQKQEADRTVMAQAAEQISGYIQTLQLTNALSESTATALLDELESLMHKDSV